METARIAIEEADRLDASVATTQTAYLRAIAITLLELQPETRDNSRGVAEVEDGWYHLELFGHRSRSGYIRTVILAGRSMLEILEPEHAHRSTVGEGQAVITAERVEVYAASAVFSLAPTTEDSVISTLVERSEYPF